MIRLMGIFLGFLAVSMVGCNDARYVYHGDDEGIIAIPARSNEFPAYYLQNAEELIVQHVGPDYEVVEEREVSKGVQETAQTNMQPGIEQTTHTSKNLTEWQIRYRRKSGVSVGQSSVPLPENKVQQAEGLEPPLSVSPASMNQNMDTPPPPNMNGL